MFTAWAKKIRKLFHRRDAKADTEASRRFYFSVVSALAESQKLSFDALAHCEIIAVLAEGILEEMRESPQASVETSEKVLEMTQEAAKISRQVAAAMKTVSDVSAMTADRALKEHPDFSA